MGGKEYMVLVKDDFSRYDDVYFIRSKSELFKSSNILQVIAVWYSFSRRNCAYCRVQVTTFRCSMQRTRQSVGVHHSQQPSVQWCGRKDDCYGRVYREGSLNSSKTYVPGMSFSSSGSPWVAQVYWACPALNFTATVANLVGKFSY